MKRTIFLPFVLTAICVIVAMPALAQDPDDQSPLDRDCVTRCRTEARSCVAVAQQQARLCADDRCGDLRATAREICAAAPDSTECAAATRAAYACVEKCREQFHADLRDCRATLQTCLSDCPPVEPPPPPKDPDCVARCRKGFNRCLERVHNAAEECRATCADLVARARRICSAAADSDACRTARRAAYACLEPCHEDPAPCLRLAHECVRSCPDAVQSQLGIRK